MKLFVAILLIATVAVALADVNQAWKEFKNKHGRKYTGKEQEAKARKNFEKNHAFIESHSAKYKAGQVSFTVAHNEMSDLDEEEIRRTKLGSRQRTDGIRSLSGANAFDPASVDMRQLPTTLDYSADNCITPVKDQLYCGSCYAFSLIGALEFHYCKKYNVSTLLSEQQIVDCSSDYGAYGCGGGYPHMVYDYMIASKGVASNPSYPYKGYEGTCKYVPTMKAANMTSFVVEYFRQEDDLLGFLVAAGGPVSITIGASVISFYFYSGGVYNDPSCPYEEHAVLLVGYGTLNGQNYWKIKNSWGTSWGLEGYIFLERGKDLCGLTTGYNPSVYPLI